MTSGSRTGLIVLGAGIGLVGLGLLGYYLYKHETGTSTYPLPFPTNFQEAQQTLINLDVMWWNSAAQSPANTVYRQQLTNEANEIRAKFPGAGPASGYTCTQLVTMGKLSQSVCDQAQANGFNPAS